MGSPEADDLRLRTHYDGGRVACSSRHTEPSEASGGAGGTEAPLRGGRCGRRRNKGNCALAHLLRGAKTWSHDVGDRVPIAKATLRSRRVSCGVIKPIR